MEICGGAVLSRRVGVALVGTLLLCHLLFTIATSGGCRKSPAILVFAFSPSPDSVEEQMAHAETLASMIGERLGVTVKVYAFDSSMDVVRALGAGQADIGLVHPFAYVAARSAARAQVLLKCVKGGKDTSRSQFIALADGGPGSLDELTGKVVGFVDPTSDSGYMFPVAHLIQSGIDPTRDLKEIVFLGSPAEVVRAVLSGRVDAGACYEDARSLAYEEFRDIYERVAVIGHTSPVPMQALVVRTAMRGSLARDVKEALLQVTARGEGRRAWTLLSKTDGLVEADDTDYDVIRGIVSALGIDLEVLAGGR